MSTAGEGLQASINDLLELTTDGLCGAGATGCGWMNPAATRTRNPNPLAERALPGREFAARKP